MNFYESSTINISKPIASMKNLFGNFYVLITILIILSLKNKIAQKFFFLLPYFLIYSLLFGLDYRAFSLAMPATGLLCAIGIFNLYSVLENKFNQKTLKKTYFALIFILFTSLLIGLNHIRNSDKLNKISLNKEKRGNPELNFLLYKNLSKDDLVKDIFVLEIFGTCHFYLK